MNTVTRRALPRPDRFRTAAGAALLTVSLALTGCTGSTPPPAPSGSSSPGPTSTATPDGTAAPAPAPAAEGDIPQLVENLAPSVVTIFTDGGLGSGVVYSEDGLILTNEHVVRGNTRVEVAFADGQRVEGTVRATDPVTDLALVQANRTGLPKPVYQTNLPRVGEGAVVLGSPLGFENTATAGIISGLHRSIPGSASNSLSLVDLIQTDAPISPGNSGGAVINMRGEIIGISEAYIPPSAGAVALGFAIPAATAVEVAEELLADGTAEHAYLGLTPGELTPQIAGQLGIDARTGVVVLAVDDDGPAARAGIRPGDVLESLEGVDLTAPEKLLAELRNRNPGDTVGFKVKRQDQSLDLKADLIARPTSNTR
ncbi:S1C family serine protease [Pseudarthrobacter oxydans]|uniref:S1-C subfamily serine protease n=1 Tax=Pseudarthrobacter oxydans TaxID=1671 RepID=A0AAW8NAB7_PSEOX|nr:trypsin-like peptidase domain-containing protein [Pseudarthrobacter oxydans]MDV2976785.1 trypsin-like peptidase domain-containing protein [Actinomycetes bacterium ARC8]WHP58520.1 trypsin-like peptidase domain-containing protein [Arthrobacter sp. KFRI-F3372]MDR6793437.1 S1-C subfamily serine protease [Pseudarthrobacter oxydans]MDR7164572.1 S1-C subfamily serine protease [Pseudarthrobacter oxydans]NSX36761.1 trypsin-like peptidase domain-containing protein [Pseudarthrobacter oxydans]